METRYSLLLFLDRSFLAKILDRPSYSVRTMIFYDLTRIVFAIILEKPGEEKGICISTEIPTRGSANREIHAWLLKYAATLRILVRNDAHQSFLRQALRGYSVASLLTLSSLRAIAYRSKVNSWHVYDRKNHPRDLTVVKVIAIGGQKVARWMIRSRRVEHLAVAGKTIKERSSRCREQRNRSDGSL